MSSSWLPISLMSPSLITRMTSALRMVDRRWAMTKDVLPTVRSSIAFWITLSVRVSTDDVASSSIRSGAFSMIALAMVICCLCPAEMLALSSRTVSSPSGRVLTKWVRPTASQALITSSSVTPSSEYTMFSRMVPSKIQVSWRIMQNRSLTFPLGMSEVGMPSMRISPESGS